MVRSPPLSCRIASFLKSTYPRSPARTPPETDSLRLLTEQKPLHLPSTPSCSATLGTQSPLTTPRTNDQGVISLPEFGLAGTGAPLLADSAGGALLRLTGVGTEPNPETCQQKLLRMGEKEMKAYMRSLARGSSSS
jgi:hypothetical protein